MDEGEFPVIATVAGMNEAKNGFGMYFKSLSYLELSLLNPKKLDEKGPASKCLARLRFGLGGFVCIA